MNFLLLCCIQLINCSILNDRGPRNHSLEFDDYVSEVDIFNTLNTIFNNMRLPLPVNVSNSINIQLQDNETISRQTNKSCLFIQTSPEINTKEDQIPLITLIMTILGVFLNFATFYILAHLHHMFPYLPTYTSSKVQSD